MVYLDVDHYTLEMLRLEYEQNEKQCAILAVPDGFLKSDECVLRVSALIKTDFGNGRIALTDKRIFFLKDGSNACKEVAKLRNITQVERLQVHSFLNAVDALVIHDPENKIKFTAWLKEERNFWYMLIEEMRAGKIVAEATKDFTAITQAIQNVLLVDAIIRSGKDEQTAHHSNLTQAADSLCYFTAYIGEDRHKLPRDTSQALQHRVDPNSGQRERKTVEVLLYTAGSTLSDNGSINSTGVPPRLWCGMGDGKVRVFDATNWQLEKTFVQTKGTVVWAGSQGIFIIDTATITSNKTLTEHQDLVSDITITDTGRYAFSASVDGSIIKWEVQTLSVICSFCLDKNCFIRSLDLSDHSLWCEQLDCFVLANDEIWVGTKDGTMFIYKLATGKLWKTIKAHDDAVRALCSAESRYVMSGAGSKDGKVAIWSPRSSSIDNPSGPNPLDE
nr:hypothetical protein BaRGS_002297 [Batillaria attramentaria]